jgi:Cdc6-like AAA superfamily ATPase
MNQYAQPKYAIRPIVPETVYTNRNEHLNYLYQAALNAIERRSMSVVLLGRRRMGKTEIFKRVVNRLFFVYGKRRIRAIDTGKRRQPDTSVCNFRPS